MMLRRGSGFAGTGRVGGANSAARGGAGESAAHQCGDQRSHEPLARLDRSRRMLARPGGCDVGDRRELVAREVGVELLEVNDLAEQPRVVEEATVVEQRNPDHLRSAVTRAAPTEGHSGVVVLDVEFPRDPLRFEAVEDGRQTPEATWRNYVVAPVSRRRRNPVQVVPDRAAGSGCEEAVEEDIAIGDVPVERDVTVVVVAHADRVAVAEGTDEPVHATV